MESSQHSSPLGRALRRLKTSGEFVRMFWRQYLADGCRDSAAALTYTTLFAIVPMMTVTFSVLALIPSFNSSGGEISEWAFENFAPGVGEQVMVYLQEFSRQAGNLTAVGVIFLFVTSILMLRTIEGNMNRIWQVQHPRKGVSSLLMYWAVLSLGPLLLGAGLGISSYLASMSLFSDAVNLLGGARFWLNLLPLGFTTLMLTMMYVVVPNCHVPIRAGLMGGFVAALFFELAKGAFAMFIKLSPSYQVVYGAFAAVPVFLLWIFISWSLVLAGAVLTRMIVVFDEHRRRIPRMQSLLRLLEIFWQRQQQGGTLAPSEVRRVLHEVGAAHWEEFRNLLMTQAIIRRTEEGSFVLARDMASLTLAELVDRLPWPMASQLHVSDEVKRPWESQVAERMRRASETVASELDVSLEQLFRQGDKH